ncbi:MAG TPA: D-alanyl-D-alanine carboxypeptidase [Streptosporangiaceae bacterium]
MSRSRRLHSAVTAAGGLAVVAVIAAAQSATAQSGAPGAPAALARSAVTRPAGGSAPDGSSTRGRASASRQGPGYVDAYAAELANAATEKQLWGRRQYSARPMASITKVMTALVVLRAGHLDRPITITAKDEAYLGCCIQGAGLYVGDVLTARQLLYAMLLPSGADAAAALAGSYGPGWPAFIKKMNATARTLNLVKTHFTGFDGVDPKTVSTPRNLLLLGEAAMKYAAFRDVVTSKSHVIVASSRNHRYYWPNTNLLLGQYPGAIGIKTGWTPAAGECLLFAAVHDKKTLIGVVLDSAAAKTGQIFIDATRMLNWGFGLHVPLPAHQPGQLPKE